MYTTPKPAKDSKTLRFNGAVLLWLILVAVLDFVIGSPEAGSLLSTVPWAMDAIMVASGIVGAIGNVVLRFMTNSPVKYPFEI